MNRPVSLLAFLALLLVAGLSPVRATAQEEGGPALLILSADADKLSDAEKKALWDEQNKALAKYKKYTLVEARTIDLLDEMVNFECLEMDAACLAQIGAKQQVAFLLYTSFDGSKLTVRIVDVAGKSYVGEFSGTADKKKLGASGGEAALAKILGPLPAAPTLILVNVGANVEAAEVFINQKRVGVTPLKVKLKEGKYTISVRKPEFLMVEETVAVASPGPVDWNASLKPVPKKVEKVVVTPPVTPPPGKKEEKKDDEGKPFYATWWFWTGVAVGAAAITGGTIWALNSGTTEYDVGTVKFSINPSAAERDFIFYQE
jgi:hypothetical protein